MEAGRPSQQISNVTAALGQRSTPAEASRRDRGWSPRPHECARGCPGTLHAAPRQKARPQHDHTSRSGENVATHPRRVPAGTSACRSRSARAVRSCACLRGCRRALLSSRTRGSGGSRARTGAWGTSWWLGAGGSAGWKAAVVNNWLLFVGVVAAGGSVRARNSRDG